MASGSDSDNRNARRVASSARETDGVDPALETMGEVAVGDVDKRDGGKSLVWVKGLTRGRGTALALPG
jgi:hypothetical protein